MVPAARAAAAIEVLDRWLAGEGRVEPILRAWGKANRYAGSGDRRAIADIVYDCVRRRRSLAWLSGAAGGRGLVHGLAQTDGWSIEDVFSGVGHAPPPLTEAERTARSDPPPDPPPDPVRYDHPDWLEPVLKASLGSTYGAAMEAMAGRAPVDLRVNRLKASRNEAMAALRSDGIDAEALPDAPEAIRCPPGARIARTGAYQDGWIEPQDAASQAIARFANLRPGETVLDYCAGGGGKALAFASHLVESGAQTGRVVAHDVDPRRMTDIDGRAARAGAKIEKMDEAKLLSSGAVFDVVFVDAPCTGSGAWRRDPEAKWRLTPDRLEELIAAQRSAFSDGLRFLRPGGRIVYATCSQIDLENQAQVRWFQDAHDRLRLSGEAAFRTDQGADGLYAAVLTDGSGAP